MDWVGPGAGVLTMDQSAAQHRNATSSETARRFILLRGYALAKTLPMAYANITLAREGPIARLTLNRPDRRNALTHDMMLELEDAFATVRDDLSCRVLVLRGAGGHFCAAGDLDAMADMPARPDNGAADSLVPAYRQFGDALLALNNLPQATISIVEGSAVGGRLC